jgi:hypothetical protein
MPAESTGVLLTRQKKVAPFEIDPTGPLGLSLISMLSMGLGELVI